MTTRLVRALCAILIALHIGALMIVLWPLGRPAQVGWLAGVFATTMMATSFIVALGLGFVMLLGRQRENVAWLLALVFFNVLPAVVIFVTAEFLGLE